MPGNYIQVGGKKRTVTFSEANVTRDERGRFAKKGSGSKSANEQIKGNKRGPRIKARPGESQQAQNKRARKAAKEFSKQFPKKLR